MRGEDLSGIRTARKTTLHLGFETFVSVLDRRWCRVLNPCCYACRERYFDQRDRIHPRSHSLARRATRVR